MKFIKLTQGMLATVDDEDFEWLNSFKWYAKKEPYTWYAARERAISRSDRRPLLMHTLLFFGAEEVDHVNMCGIDNQKVNLRFSTRAENRQNRVKLRGKTTSRYKGVCWKTFRSGNGTWNVRCATKEGRGKGNGGRVWIGNFSDQIVAAMAYDAVARKNFGKFARLNFPTDGERSAYSDTHGIYGSFR